MTSAFVTALLNGPEDLEKFRNPEICGMCGCEDLSCRCYDTHDYDSYEMPAVEEESEYCRGCLFDKRYCECWKGEWDFISDADDFNPFPEADEFSHLFVEQHWYWFPRRHELSKGDTSWKRQVREPRQWARHERRILAKVHPIGLETAVQIADVVENLRDQRTHEYVA